MVRSRASRIGRREEAGEREHQERRAVGRDAPDRAARPARCGRDVPTAFGRVAGRRLRSAARPASTPPRSRARPSCCPGRPAAPSGRRRRSAGSRARTRGPWRSASRARMSQPASRSPPVPRHASSTALAPTSPPSSGIRPTCESSPSARSATSATSAASATGRRQPNGHVIADGQGDRGDRLAERVGLVGVADDDEGQRRQQIGGDGDDGRARAAPTAIAPAGRATARRARARSPRRRAGAGRDRASGPAHGAAVT